MRAKKIISIILWIIIGLSVGYIIPTIFDLLVG